VDWIPPRLLACPVVGGARQDGHIATFPEELPHRLIKMFSFVDDTVLDPFLGSGTTSLAAKNLKRNSVGFEINKEFQPFIEEKLGVNSPELDSPEFKFISTKPSLNFEEEIKKLPYVFVDFHKFDKKIDPKKLQYGSKIDKNSGKREDFYRVKKVLTADTLLLSNDLTVKLLGVKENSQINGEAIKFLEKKTNNQQIFLRFDEEKYDQANNLLAYVYLKNKTFLNAHLIKNGLAFTDREIDHKNRTKFEKLEKEYVQSK
jgi:hypothetical protein